MKPTRHLRTPQPISSSLRRLIVASLILGWLALLVGSRPLWAGQLVVILGKDGAPMALASGGEFIYGEGDNRRRLTLPSFYMDKYEVTTKRYLAFRQATGRKERFKVNEAIQASEGDRPIIGVDWQDALE